MTNHTPRAAHAARPAGSPLDRLLQDPLIRLVMASDGVVDDDIRHLAERVGARRARNLPPIPAFSRPQDCAGCA